MYIYLFVHLICFTFWLSKKIIKLLEFLYFDYLIDFIIYYMYYYILCIMIYRIRKGSNSICPMPFTISNSFLSFPRNKKKWQLFTNVDISNSIYKILLIYIFGSPNAYDFFLIYCICRFVLWKMRGYACLRDWMIWVKRHKIKLAYTENRYIRDR